MQSKAIETEGEEMQGLVQSAGLDSMYLVVGAWPSHCPAEGLGAASLSGPEPLKTCPLKHSG